MRDLAASHAVRARVLIRTLPGGGKGLPEHFMLKTERKSPSFTRLPSRRRPGVGGGSAESAFATLKAELYGAEHPFSSKAGARRAIFDYIETFYNRRCRHSSLGMLSPADFLKQYFQSHKPTLN